MKKIASIVVLLLITLFTANSLNIKLASPLPEDSEWHRALSEMSREWNQITGGAVRIRIYPGGIAGTGEDVVRKMRIGQVDMAVLTSTTIATIVPDTFAMSMPFYLQSEDELDYMIDEMAPAFDQAFQEKGFRMLGWSKSGWLYFYSSKRIETPNDLRNLKMSIAPEDQEPIDAYKELGFNIIPLDVNDILMGLQSGMIESFYTTPLAAAAFQWFALAPYMLNFKIAPLLAGLVVSERTWKRIPQRYHQELKESVERTTRGFYRRTRDLESRAMDTMNDNGLRITEISESQELLWRSVLGSDFASFVGEDKVISRAIFTRYRNIVDGYRNRE